MEPRIWLNLTDWLESFYLKELKKPCAPNLSALENQYTMKRELPLKTEMEIKSNIDNGILIDPKLLPLSLVVLKTLTLDLDAESCIWEVPQEQPFPTYLTSSDPKVLCMPSNSQLDPEEI